MKKTILLTGCNGFIGNHIYQRLNGEYTIICVSHNRPEQSEKKIITYDDLFKGNTAINDIFAIIHCAAKVHDMKMVGNDERLYYESNTVLTKKLAEFGKARGVHFFIFASSVKVMGDSTPGRILTEQDSPDASDPYGRSKLDAEKELKTIFNNSGTHCCILRFPMVYGPGNKGNMVSLLKVARKKIPLPLGGAFGKERSFLYVKNLTDAIAGILTTSGKHGVFTFFLTDNRDITSAGLYNLIYKYLNNRNGVFSIPGIVVLLLVYFTGKKGRAVYSRLFQDYRFSCDKFMSFYGWKPPFTIETGIGETVEWYRKYVSTN